jgi:hypothetical protein
MVNLLGLVIILRRWPFTIFEEVHGSERSSPLRSFIVMRGHFVFRKSLVISNICDDLPLYYFIKIKIFQFNFSMQIYYFKIYFDNSLQYNVIID